MVVRALGAQYSPRQGAGVTGSKSGNSKLHRADNPDAIDRPSCCGTTNDINIAIMMMIV